MSPQQKKKKLPYKLVLTLIDDLENMGTRYIYFTGGGDPSMHPKLIELIEYVKNKGLICDMSTNFTLINKEKANTSHRINTSRKRKKKLFSPPLGSSVSR